MKCPNCGNELNDAAKFCVDCGLPIPDEPQAEATETELPAAEESVTPVVEPEPALENESAIAPSPKALLDSVQAIERPEQEPTEPVEKAEAEQKPPVTVMVQTQTDPRMLLTAAQYFFLTILFHLPVIGLVFLFVWGCGKPKNISLKRYSLAMLTLRLISCFLALAGAVVFLLGLTGMIPGFLIRIEPWIWR